MRPQLKAQMLLAGSLLIFMTAGIASTNKQRGDITLSLITLTTNNESALLGQDNGNSDDSSQMSGKFNILKQRERNYLKSSGEILGSDVSQLDFKLGSYSQYDITFRHTRQPHLLSTTARTPFEGVESDTLTLPSFGATQYTTTGAMPLSSSHSIDIGTERATAELRLSLQPMKGWRFNITIKQDKKTGTQALAGTVGANAGKVSASTLPAPVDYRTEDFGFSVAYNNSDYQIEVGYALSRFFNNNNSLKWENPFLTTPAAFGPPAPAYPTDSQISLAPDNEHHKLTLQGGITLPMASRLTMIAEYGQMSQDNTLLPYTVNSGSSVTTVMPRSDSDAEIETVHLTLNLASRPLPKLTLNAKYRLYESNNTTPRDLFLRVPNDTGDQFASTASTASYNLDYDQTQQQINLDGSYYFGRGTALKLGLERDIRERNHRAVKETTEDSLSAKLKSRFGSRVSGNISYAHAERRGSDYDPSRAYLDMHSEDYINTRLPLANSEGDFDNNPFLTQSDIADRDRNTYGLTINIIPANSWMVGLYARKTADDYTNTLLGLDSSDTQSATLDISFSPEQGSTFYTYYTYEEMAQRVDGRSFNPFGPGGSWGNAQNENNNWQADIDDEVETIGIGGRFHVMGDRVIINSRYSYSMGDNKISVSDPAQSATAIPDSQTARHRFLVEGGYNYSRNWLFTLGTQYEKYDAKNWARDDINPASGDVDGLLLLTGQEPDYEAYMVYLTGRYSWR